MPSARALWSLMLAMTPVAIAEFDQCARPSGVWAGSTRPGDHDGTRPVRAPAQLSTTHVRRSCPQGFGRSRGYAIAYNGGNVFVAGYACATSLSDAARP